MPHLIFSRRADNRHLTEEEIMRMAPAAYATGHKDTLSDRYGEVDSRQVIEIMRDYGFGVSQAAQKKVRKSSEVPFAEHLVAFSRPNALYDSNAVQPEIIMYNSRNGLSSLKLFVGLFRFICSNGMVAGEGMDFRVRHTTTRISDLEQAISGAVEAMPVIMDRMQRMKSVQLTERDTLEFVKNATTLRWEWAETHKIWNGVDNGTYASTGTVDDIANKLMRYEDRSNDLWTVFNRTQEKLIRGKVDVVSVTDKARLGKVRSAPAVRSIGESVRINRQLWDMAEELAA
jgi:hypothetical protein